MVELSLKAWDFMILSMLAVHPYVLVTMQQGEATRRFETVTCLDTLSFNGSEEYSLQNQSLVC